MSQTDVPTLPIPLILLVHLHILEYPHANNPEYDHQIFNPRTRGLRERAKIMEDVTYFLVGKVEGKSAKSILSTYPCTQPSESLAFRTSLTKYLEALRHQSIYPASARPGAKAGLKAPNGADSESVASWWKDVVVRKSLLEECSGEKFERLIVSLSTHALMKASHCIPPDKISIFLRTQPTVYTTALAGYQSKKHAWAKAASIMTKSEHDLKILRNSLNGVTTSKYHAVPTGKLQALVAFKLQALLQGHWAGEEGKGALSFLVQLAGIKSSRTPSSIADFEISAASKPVGLPSPLPIAAAHHPSHLKRLRRPIFQPRSKSEDGIASIAASRPHAEIMLAEHLDSERRMRQNLVDSISRMKKTGLEMKAKLISHTSVRSSKLFWTPPISFLNPIYIEHAPGKDLLISLGLAVEYEALDGEDSKEDTLEKKIEHIRNSVLPPYPAIPDQSAPRKPPLDARQADGKSKIPQTSRNRHTRPITESTSSSLNIPGAGGSVTPLMSPSKSARDIRRKSVRFSMATRRTERAASMFSVCSDGLDDEVERLVDETNDFPTDDEDTDDEAFSFSPFKTPKSKVRPTTNRIWTAGTPVQGKRNGPGQATPKLRVPSALTRLLDMGPSVSLPSMPSTTSSAFEGACDDFDTVDATPRPPKRGLLRELDSSNVQQSEDGDVFGDDPPSMTLKDILLSADTSHFDLLEASTEEIEEGMLVEDTSFIWE